MATGQLIFQPPMFDDWQAEDQQCEFEEWKSQVTLALQQRGMVCYDL